MANFQLNETIDYIIVGAGIAGTVLASRLHEKNPSLSILLLEAGEDQSRHPNVPSPLTVALLRASEADWNYESVPQINLDHRKFYAGAGKALGGGSVINYGVWTRGDSQDYDAWAALVGDTKWSYQGLLPYFQKSERSQATDIPKELHGYHGPVPITSVTSSRRKYPLRQPIKDAWASVGVNEVPDINSGSTLGLAEVAEARINGERVIASSVYSLGGITIKTGTLVKRVLIDDQKDQKVAYGVEVVDGRRYYANREVILSAGSYRSPQLLMLSGIGSASELQKHGVVSIVDSPEVGKNLWDHIGTKQFWRLRHPGTGASIGSPEWKDPLFTKGNPADWFALQTVSQKELKPALLKDEYPAEEVNALIDSPRCHLCTYVQYAALNPSEPEIPMDGTHVTTFVLGMLPTSRGSVTLASADVTVPPVIDFNYYLTEADRFRMREGIRTLATVLTETPAGQEIIERETVPEGYEPIHRNSTDGEIDSRVRQSAVSISHPSGTASMGKVVDTELRVIGVQGLRVVDASVLPCPITAPIQACIYALAEQAADLIG